MTRILIILAFFAAIDQSIGQQVCTPKCGPACCTLTANPPTNGIGPFTYEWPDGSTQTTFDACSTGIYVVTVTDDCSNTGTESYDVTIHETIPINCRHRFAPSTVWVAGCDIDICNNNTAVLVIDADPNTADNNCTLTDPNGVVFTANSNGSVALQPSDIIGGLWTLECEDDNQCITSTTFTFTITTCEIFPTCVATAVTDCNANDGTITVTENGVGPYSYAWDNPAASGNPATGLPTGIYTVTVTDNNGHTGTASCEVLDAAPITLAVTGSCS